MDKKLKYSDYKRIKTEKKEVNELSWAALLCGAVIATVNSYKALVSVGSACIMYTLLAILGCCLFIVGGFCPRLLKKPFALLKKIIRKAGSFILKILLILIYPLFVLTAVAVKIMSPARSNVVRYENFNEPQGFVSFDEKSHTSGMNPFINAVSSVLSVLSGRGMKLFVPLIFMLMLLGCIFFFASTSSVFSFIYTLF